MAREPAYELTDAEKRDLIKLIELGRPLPEKYRFLLFEDKREVARLNLGSDIGQTSHNLLALVGSQ